MTDRPIRVAHLTTVDLTLRFLLGRQLEALADEGYEVTAISKSGPWSDALVSDGIRFVPWPHAGRSWQPLADLRSLLSLLRILRRERFDLLHTHNPKPGILGRAAARIAKVPCVVNTVHGLYATPADSWPRKAVVLGLERLAAARSDLELFQSAEDLEWATRIGLGNEATRRYLGNGTDLSFFSRAQVSDDLLRGLRRELEIEDGVPVVGTVGRLSVEKGTREFFAAARQVRSRDARVVFVAVGDRDLDARGVLSETEMAEARKDVLVTGWRTDVRELLALMDVFVLPSWREGVPRSAIEAAAMQRPLILSDIRGCREIVRPGREGILVPPRDARSLTDAIARLVDDPDERRRLGANARKRAEEGFDERAVVSTLLSNYRRLLFEKGLVGSEEGGVTVRRARSNDASALAHLHTRGLSGAFLPTLGRPFMESLYRALVRDQEAAVLVAEDPDGIIGFAAGVLSVRRFYRRFLLRRGARALVAAVPRLLRPGTWRRILETSTYPARAMGPDAELLAIAVTERRRGEGLGRRLSNRLVESLAERGAAEIRVVVASDNSEAIRFYESVGFRRMGGISVHKGTASDVLRIRCRSSQV